MKEDRGFIFGCLVNILIWAIFRNFPWHYWPPKINLVIGIIGLIFAAIKYFVE